MPGYGSRGYQGRGRPSGGDTGRGSQPNRPSGGGQSGPRGQGGRQREIQQNIKREQDKKEAQKQNQLQEQRQRQEQLKVEEAAKKQADQRRQLAESLKQAGMVSGSGLGGQGLWKTAPVGTKDKKVLEYLKNPNVYYSTYGKGADAYTTAFQKELTGYGGLVYSDPENYDPYNRGFFTPFNPANYPDEYPGFGGDPGGPGGYSGWPGGDGGGDGGDGGYYGYGPAGGPTPEQMAGFYTPQANLQQAMINVHKSPTVFKKRGGIVSLLRLS
jgi:hypothetical protein